MLGVLVSWRSLLAMTALLGVAIGAHGSNAVPTERSLLIVPAPDAATEVGSMSTSATDAPPPYDVVHELRAIGEQANPPMAAATAEHEAWIPAAGKCVRPTAKQQAVLRMRLAGWIDHQHRDEQDDAFEGLALRVGCMETTGELIVDMHVDRTRKGDTRQSLSRWWIVSMTDDDITVIAEREATATNDWMEWADEGMVLVSVLVDLDGDGTRDVAWNRIEHEGGASRSSYALSGFLATTDTNTPIAAMDGILDVSVRGPSVVLSLGVDDEHLAYRCIDANLALVHCAAGDKAQAAAARIAIAARFMEMTAPELPDRDQLLADLTTLGVAAGDHEELLAAVPATTSEQRAQRHVARFVARVRPQDVLETASASTHETAQNHFAQLRTRLGDSACEAAPLADADTARVNGWIAAQKRPRNSELQAITITPACGPYVWAAWDTWTTAGQSVGVRHEVLLALGDSIASLVPFELEATGDPTVGPASAQSSIFFHHGDAIVGAVIYYLGDGQAQLIAISDGRVVARRNGQFRLYTFDDRWSDTSDDLIADGDGHTWWHATPDGLERVGSNELRAHAARQAAIKLLDNFETGEPADYVRALRTLGAPASLVREVAALSDR